jgi:Kef-type K+ transport system membrane component KefB
VALALVGALVGLGLAAAPVLTALALTTTAIGALLPALRDGGHLAPPYGPLILAAGALGESAPLIVLSLILAGLAGVGLQALILLGFAGGAALAILGAARGSGGRFAHALDRGMGNSGQLPLRLMLMLMMALAILAEHMGIDLVLGAFVAGAITRAAVPHRLHEELMARLDGIGSGFLIPIFFVVSGMRLDLPALEQHPHALLMVPVWAALMLAARGLPALLLYRGLLDRRGRMALGLHAGTQLPLVVAITGIAVARGVMPGEQAAAMVGGGMLSLLLFPALARWLLARRPPACQSAPAPEGGRGHG